MWKTKIYLFSVSHLVNEANELSRAEHGGKHLCVTATKTVWASPFSHLCTKLTSSWWAGCKAVQRGPTAQRSSTPSLPADQTFILLFGENDTDSWQRLLRTAFDLFQECNGTGGRKRERKKCKRNGRPERPAHISSLLTGLRVTPGILVKVYAEVSVRVPFKRMKEIG